MTASIPFRVKPMLATLVREPFDREGWSYEEKYDGYRILAYKEGGSVRLYSRNDIDRTSRFPKVAEAVRQLKATTLLLDGEVSVFDKAGVSRFQLMQRLQKDISVYAVFDCLYKDGRDLRRLPLAERRKILEQIIKPAKAIMPSRRLANNGLEAFRVATKNKFEGLVAKNLASPYVQGRSELWLKVKVSQQDEFVIGGFTAPSGTRNYFGALLLGVYDRAGKLTYVGKVGTGFNEERLASLHKQFRPLVRRESSFILAPREKNTTFLAPKLVAQISYQEWTADKKLRHPVFLGLRDDKAAREVHSPEPAA